jgi:hypothetical protein
MILVLDRCVSRCIRFVVHGRPFSFSCSIQESNKQSRSTPTLQFQFVWNKSEICANETTTNHTKLARSRHRVCGSIQSISLQTLAPNPTVAMREAWFFTLRERIMGLTRSHWFTSAVHDWWWFVEVLICVNSNSMRFTAADDTNYHRLT